MPIKFLVLGGGYLGGGGGGRKCQFQFYWARFMSKAPDPLCSQKVWRKITIVKFKGSLRGNLREKLSGI